MASTQSSELTQTNTTGPQQLLCFKGSSAYTACATWRNKTDLVPDKWAIVLLVCWLSGPHTVAMSTASYAKSGLAAAAAAAAASRLHTSLCCFQ
jgi:hypothetical protein